jgi:hypothetical protein
LLRCGLNESSVRAEARSGDLGLNYEQAMHIKSDRELVRRSGACLKIEGEIDFDRIDGIAGAV